MKSTFAGAISLIIFISGYAAIFSSFQDVRQTIRTEQFKGITLPPPVLKIMSVEFQTLIADFFFVKASQFYGGKVIENQKPTRDDWEWFYKTLDGITELDPYFQDPYYVGNAFLTWDAHMFDEANALLEKATNAREWDWWFPFYIGFNKFYFQRDYKGGADYLLKASERPGAWPVLPKLAARLYYYDKRTENALAFLVNFWENESDPRRKKEFEIRIDALQKILLLEKGVKTFQDQWGKLPQNLNELVKTGIIEEIPEDPYKGKFFITPNGRIATTSKLAFAHLEQQKNKEKQETPSAE